MSTGEVMFCWLKNGQKVVGQVIEHQTQTGDKELIQLINVLSIQQAITPTGQIATALVPDLLMIEYSIPFCLDLTKDAFSWHILSADAGLCKDYWSNINRCLEQLRAKRSNIKVARNLSDVNS